MLQRSSLQELRDKPPNDDGDFLEVVRRCGGNGNKPDPDYLAAHCGLILTRLTAAVELGKKAQAIVDKASVLELVETNKIDRLMLVPLHSATHTRPAAIPSDVGPTV